VFKKRPTPSLIARKVVSIAVKAPARVAIVFIDLRKVGGSSRGWGSTFLFVLSSGTGGGVGCDHGGLLILVQKPIYSSK
jgi:hypothetical protein